MAVDIEPDLHPYPLPPLHDRVWLEQIAYRFVTFEDLPSLEWDGEFTHFRRLYRETFRSTSLGRALMWVADLPFTGIIGQVFVQLTSGRRELADGTLRAYFYGFRVKMPYRNLGVGSRLLETVEKDLKHRKYRWVTLNVARENPDACRFYERHGYRVVASDQGYWSYLDDSGKRHDMHEPAWRMEKHLMLIES